MTRAALCALFLSLAWAPGASAQETDQVIPQAMNNLAHEYAVCAAYYSVVAIAAENSNDVELGTKYNAAASSALENAALAGDEAGLLPETHQARIEIAVTEMSERIGGNTSNISILMADYSDSCLEAMNDIAGAMERLISIEYEKQTGSPLPAD